MDWFDVFAVQGILKSLLQHHSLKASGLRHSAFLKGGPSSGDFLHTGVRLGDLSNGHVRCIFGEVLDVTIHVSHPWTPPHL